MAGLHNNIQAQISAKLQSLDTKKKLLMATAEVEAAVRPKNAVAALMAVNPGTSAEMAKIREMQLEIDAIRSRFGNLNLLQGGGGSQRTSVHMLYLQHDTAQGPLHSAPSQWHTRRIGHNLFGRHRISNILHLGGEILLSSEPLDPGGCSSRPRPMALFRLRPQHPDRGEVLLHNELPRAPDQETHVRPARTGQA